MYPRACLAVVLLLSMGLLAGCPTSNAPEQSVPPEGAADVSVPPPGEPATPAAVDATEAPTEIPTGLTGELAVGIPCGIAMAYKEVRDKVKTANPGLEFKDQVKNIGPMVKELLDGKAHLDVFISIGDKEIDRLLEAGIVDGEPVPFIVQYMQLAVQLGNPLKIETLEDLGKDEIKTVAVCQPELSIGFYGQKALESVDVWNKLVSAGKVIRPDQPLKAKALVIEKKADAAFIYACCSTKKWETDDPERSIEGKADVVMTVPKEAYGGMYGVAVVMADASNKETAHKFIQALLAPEAQDVFADWGYGRLDESNMPEG